MGPQVDGADRSGVQYHVRGFGAADREAILELYRTADHPTLDRERFVWKYEAAPYVYHVPITVAEAGGDVVAAQPFFALELSVGGSRRLALQPSDGVVHPDHRGQGLLARMTDAALEVYRDCDVSFVFAFQSAAGSGGPPTPAPGSDAGAVAAPDYRDLGFQRVAEPPTYYRLQDAAALARAWGDRWASPAARTLQPVLDGYNGLADLRLRAPGAVTVERYDSVPAALLAGIEYDRRRRGVHVHRDARFYDWRFDDPAREYTAFVAERAGESVAGLVVAEAPGDDAVRLVDLTPLPRDGDHEGLEAILERVVREYADAALIAAPPVLPGSLARRAGFRRDDRPPLRSVGAPTTHLVRGLDAGTEIGGVDVADPDSWQLSFAERDCC